MYAEILICAVLGACGIGLLLCIFMGVRNDVVYKVRSKAIDVVYDGNTDWHEDREKYFTSASSYDRMMWQWNKWTFKQFYPELAARVK